MAEMVKGACAWQRGGVAKEGGTCVVKDGYAWQMQACMAKGGACVVKAPCMVKGEGAGVAGDTATAEGGTHPTGMHSCVNIKFDSLLNPPGSYNTFAFTLTFATM